jgi:hypothetical protein
MRVDKNLLRLFYLWIYNPKRFFIEIVSRFKDKSSKIQVLYIILSFLFPLIGGTLLFSFLARFAVVNIADKILPKALMWFIFVFLAYGVNLLTFLMIPGISLKYQLNQQGLGNIRIFSRINILRNNLFQIPVIVVLIITNLTCFRETWKIYNLGIYLGMVVILMFTWVTIFQVSSLPSIRLQLNLEDEHKRVIQFYQYGFKAIWSTVIFTAFCFLLDFALKRWLGAPDMTLWQRLAMLLLHGN